jgi:hypothetical protein
VESEPSWVIANTTTSTAPGNAPGPTLAGGGNAPAGGQGAGGGAAVQPPNAAPNPPPANTGNPTVIIHITGILGETEKKFVEKEMDRLADPGGNRGHFWRSSGGVTEVAIYPVSDPVAYAKKLEVLGTTRVQGREIWLTVKKLDVPPEVAAEPPKTPRSTRKPDPQAPEGADFLTQALFDLKSSDLFKRKDAAERLARTPVNDSRRSEVAKGLVEAIEAERDGFAIADLFKALAVWGNKENAATAAKFIKHEHHFARAEAVNALVRFNDDNYMEALAECLGDNLVNEPIITYFQAMGPKGEKTVLKVMKLGDFSKVWLNKAACKILGSIGTKASIPVLQQAITDVHLRGEAEPALRAVMARGGK